MRIIKRKRKGRTTEELYTEVCGLQQGDSVKRIYIGTSTTATVERMEEAIKQATKIRRKLEFTRPSVKY